MKFSKVTTHSTQHIQADDGYEYERRGPECWYQCMKNVKYLFDDCEELEAAYQKYWKDILEKQNCMNETIFVCYQCMKNVKYLFDDSRCHKCTQLTPEEVRGH